MAALTLNVAAMSVSFAIARVASLSDRETTAIAMELGIPAAVYSAFMFITAGLFARLMFRHNGGLVARPRRLREDDRVAGAFAPSEDELSAAEHYSRIATAWDAGQDQNSPGGHRRRTRLGATLSVIGPGPGELLEIGIGAGHLIPPLERAGWTVHGMEPAPAMLELARERAPASAGRLRAARAEALPYENDFFDVVVAVGVLEYTDMERSMPELSRVLRPGGRAVLCLRNGRAPIAWWRRRVVHPAARAVKSQVHAGRRPPLRRRPPLSPARARRSLADAGLVLRSSDLVGCEVLPDPLDVMAPALGRRAAQAAERSALLRSVLGTQRVLLAEKELPSATTP